MLLIKHNASSVITSALAFSYLSLLATICAKKFYQNDNVTCQFYQNTWIILVEIYTFVELFVNRMLYLYIPLGRLKVRILLIFWYLDNWSLAAFGIQWPIPLILLHNYAESAIFEWNSGFRIRTFSRLSSKSEAIAVIPSGGGVKIH